MLQNLFKGDAELKRNLVDLIQQTDSVVSKTLTGLAFDARLEVQKQLPSWVNTTRPFLKNSVVYQGAKANKLEAIIGFAERADFAELLEEGGERTPKQSSSLAVPTQDIKRNNKGAISKAYRPKALLQKQGVFVERKDGTTGIWRQVKKKPLELLYVFKKKTTYKKKFMHFRETVQEVITKNYEARFAAAISKAIKAGNAA